MNNVVWLNYGKKIDYKRSLCYFCKQSITNAPIKWDLVYDKKQNRHRKFKGIKCFFNPDFFIVCSRCYYEDIDILLKKQEKESFNQKSPWVIVGVIILLLVIGIIIYLLS